MLGVIDKAELSSGSRQSSFDHGDVMSFNASNMASGGIFRLPRDLYFVCICKGKRAEKAQVTSNPGHDKIQSGIHRRDVHRGHDVIAASHFKTGQPFRKHKTDK